ncbi:MAG: hypothetical protein LC126_05725 [Bryobacterales bacterium]|nr:hypothetical protein [Bryobacterales bacterium]
MGTVRLLLFTEIPTAVLVLAAFDSVTLQLVVPPELTVAGEQLTEVSVAALTRDTVAVFDPPFSDAVTDA